MSAYAVDRTVKSPFALVSQALGKPSVWVGKGARLLRMLLGYLASDHAREKMQRLHARGHIEAIPTPLQMFVGAVDMLRFWISPAAADYYAKNNLNYTFHQLLRFLDEPASIVDPVGFFSTRDGIVGHLMQVVHANPHYDLQLLDAFDDGLDALESQILQMLEGTHPRAQSIRAIVEEPDYHERLLVYVRQWRATPGGARLLRDNIANNPRFIEIEKTFGTLTDSMRYFCRLPKTPVAAALHLLTVKSFPSTWVAPT